ncbi:transcription factor MAMYB [Mercurialis annua]|uniref:transcription factor MAMYB n=1 Tax=Mercurialis annua TaxID=3986 RepID=UPI0021606A8E|nr:transcription factor MAMYB [Mercurialis annua]
MEFIDEDARPRFVFQSRQNQSSQTNQENQQKPLNKPLLIFTVALFLMFLILSILFIDTEPLKSILIWVSISFIIGPFAPSNITGGDITVGQGPIVEPLEEEPEIVNEKKLPKKRSKQVRSEENLVGSIQNVELTNGSLVKEKKIESLKKIEGEREWNEEDLVMLKKLMAKNPVGKARRWEVIAEAFNGGHKVESVIKIAKEMGERKWDDNDSYARFLKNRKPIDTRVEAEINGVMGDDGDVVGWSGGEDIALLNALKAFPKDAAMRWEKIAAAVPGRSKAACVKRMAELKRDFRSSKS